jgi:glycine C-acetyltransferase
MTKRLVSFLRDEIADLKAKSLYQELSILETAQSSRVIMNGKKVITLSTNNYLGLTNHPGMVKAAIGATKKYGVGTGAVRQIAGTMKLHQDAEKKLAKFKREESTLLFATGVMANSGTIPALIGEGDAVLSDQLNHGSIIDGCRLTKAVRKIYAHNDMGELEKVLKDPEVRNARRRWIISDGVFSMDGDIAPLDEIVKLAEEHDCLTMVDDAHGEGVLGENGRGIVDHFDLHGKVDVDIGTLSKAFGCMGGIASGPKELRDYLIQRARTFLFSTSHPPGVVAAIIEAINVIEDEKWRHKTLWKNTDYFKKELKSMGFDTGKSITPITPVMVGESATAMKLSERLFEEGLFVKPIVFPLVARDAARVRNIVTAEHTKEDLDECLGIYEKVGKELKII